MANKENKKYIEDIPEKEEELWEEEEDNDLESGDNPEERERMNK
jgi:hypothetical protein